MEVGTTVERKKAYSILSRKPLILLVRPKRSGTLGPTGS